MALRISHRNSYGGLLPGNVRLYRTYGDVFDREPDLLAIEARISRLPAEDMAAWIGLGVARMALIPELG